jgi:hypothetical protein
LAVSENAIGMGLGMLAITATWAVALAAFAGLGLTFLRWARLERDGAEGLFAAVWIGWAIALGVLQVWHLFHPVDVWARDLLLTLGAAALTWNLRPVLAQLRPVIRRILPFAAAAVLLALWLANRAMAPEMNPDSGLYHLSNVRWLSEYPIVPGLGNLNWRLALNSSYYVYMAAMEFGRWSHRAQHVAIYLPLLALGLQIGWSGYSVLLDTRPVRCQDVFRFVLAPAIVWKMWAGAQEVEPDLAVWVLGVVIVDQLIRLVQDAHRGRTGWTSVVVVLVMSSTAVTVKLSAGMLGIMACVVALAWQARMERKSTGVHVRSFPILVAILPSGLLVAVWVLRGYLLSGYPAFPSTWGGIAVDWRVSSSLAINEARWIMSWARLPGVAPDVVLKDWAWLGPWLKNLKTFGSFDILAPLAIAFVGLLVALGRRSRWEAPDLGIAAVAAVPASSLGFWFAIAPEPRFAGSAAWLLAACSVLLAAERWDVRRAPRFARVLLLVSAVAAVAPYLTAPTRIHAGPEGGFYALPHVSVVEVTLPSGLTYLRPTAEMDNQCWDAPLPCAPYPPDDLQLRWPGDLRGGFKVAQGEAE